MNNFSKSLKRVGIIETGGKFSFKKFETQKFICFVKYNF